MKGRRQVPDVFVFQIGDALPAHVRHRHPDRQTKNERAIDQTPPVLRARGVMLVNVQRVLVHRHQAEPGVVVFSDGPSGPMFVNIADVEFFKISPVIHFSFPEILPPRSSFLRGRYLTGYFSTNRLAMTSRCNSLVPLPITSSGASW